MDSLNRYLVAQRDSYLTALAEIKAGKKQSHWMWYIFPQLAGLGRSETSKVYGIKNIEEAKAYLKHPVLGGRLIEISTALLQLPAADAHSIFGSPDDLKLRSCMTLFSLVQGAENTFQHVLNKFFNSEKDQKTLSLVFG